MEQDFFNPRWEDGDVVYHARLPLEVASNRKLHCCVGIAILQSGEKSALAALPHAPSDIREAAPTDADLPRMNTTPYLPCVIVFAAVILLGIPVERAACCT